MAGVPDLDQHVAAHHGAHPVPADAGLRFGECGAAAVTAVLLACGPPRPGTSPRGCVAGVGDDRGGRAVGQHLTVAQEHDPLGERLDLAHVVAGEQQGGVVVVVQPGEGVAHPQGDVGVERRGGLVQHHEAGPVHDGLGDADEGGLPGRQAHAGLVAQVADVELVDDPVDDAGRVGVVVEVGEEAQRLVHAAAGRGGGGSRRRSPRPPSPRCARWAGDGPAARPTRRRGRWRRGA